MKKRGLALLLACCVIVGAAAEPWGGVSVSAAQEREETQEIREETEEPLIQEQENLKEAYLQEGDYKYQVLEDGTVEITDYSGDATELVVPEEIAGKRVTSIGKEAFFRCDSLTSVTIPGSVTSIGNGAFFWCGLTSVTISEGVTSIGEEAFKNCSSLADVTIPGSVTSIGNGAFGDCISLTSVTIPGSVTNIGDSAFRDCNSLTDVTISEGVASIGDSAFRDCNSLADVTIPGSVTSIGNGAFWDCDNLTSIMISGSMTSIGEEAFWGCDSLTNVTIPGSVTGIGEEAFEYCSSLESITIPGSMMSIGNLAFWGCDSLTSITISGSMTSIGEEAFWSCDSLTNITIPGSMTSIGEEAFWGCDSLTSITIPGSVTSIGDSAFRDCDSLTSVTILGNVTSIGNLAFEYCSSLTSVTISGSMTSIGDWAFSGCSNLTSITIPESVTSIGNGAFGDCISLTSVTIPGSVTSIGEEAFWGCDSLTSVTISEGVTSIGKAAFIGCGLASVTIPGSVMNIGSRAFSGCNSLTDITILEGVTSIEDWAFSGCDSLTSIIIPESVTYIGDWAFYNCNKLTIYCTENSYAHQYAMEEGIPYKLFYSTPPDTPALSSNAFTITVVDGEYKTPIGGASVKFGNTVYTTDEKGIVQIEAGKEASEVFCSTEAEGYRLDMQYVTARNGMIEYIYLYAEEGGLQVNYVKGVYGDTNKNLLKQKIYLGTNENNIALSDGNGQSLTITVQGRGNIVKYELLANGKTVRENDTGSFAVPLIVRDNGKELETPLLEPDSPFAAGDELSVRITDDAGEQATASIGLRICKSGYKVDEVEKSGKLKIGKNIKVTMPNDIPFVGGSELSFGFIDSIPIDLEVYADGKIKVSLNKPATQNIERFKEDYDELAARAKNVSSAAYRFGGTPQPFGAGFFTVKGNVLGYGEGYLGELEDGKMVVNVEILLSVDASGGYTQYFFAGMVPIYLTVKGGVSVSSGVKASIKQEDYLFSIDGGFGTMSGKVYLNANAGVGVKDAVSLDVEGEASLNVVWKPSRNYQKIYMEDWLKMHAQVFLWEKDIWESGEQQFVIYESGSEEEAATEGANSLKRSKELYDTSSYRLISRNNPKESEGALETAPLRLAEPGGASVTVVQDFAEPTAAPALIEAGGKSYLFYLSDVASRAAENRTALVYAVSEDGVSWSEPVQLIPESEDNTADFQYDIATDGENIHLVWTEAAKPLETGAALEDAAENLRVSYAVISAADGQLKERAVLTETAGCHTLPRVLLKEGAPYAAWLTNDLAGGKGMFGDGNGYKITVRDMASDEDFLVKEFSGGEAVVSMDMGLMGEASMDGPVIACLLDTDGALETSEDRNITYAGQEGEGILASNTKMAANPLFSESEGRGVLFWYEDGALKYTEDLKEVQSAPDWESAGFNASFLPVSENGGRGKILWETSNQGEGSCIYAVDNLGGGNWSAPYKLTGTESCYAVRPNGYCKGEDVLLTYLHSEKQEDGSVRKSICVTRAADYTDVALEYAVYDEAAVRISENLPLTLAVSNRGSAAVDGFAVLADGTEIARISDADLGVGETKEYTVDGFSVPQEIADGVTAYKIAVSADGDTDVSNNETEIKLGYTDLYLMAETGLMDGEDCVSVSILNASDIPSSAVLKLYADKEDGEVLYEKSVGEIRRESGTGLMLPLGKYTKEHCTFYLAVEPEREDCITGNNREFIYTGFGTGMEGGTLVPDPVTYTVSFDSAGGSAVEPQQVEEYGKAAEPLSPARDGYNFTGWYLNGAPYDFGKAVESDITLTAGWEQQERAAMPQATVASGTKVEKGTKVNLTCATVGADIYYTTDGTEPTASSAKYTGSLTINEDMTVKAIAVLEGYLPSETAVFIWTVETQKAGESTGEAGKNPAQEKTGEAGKNPAQENAGGTGKNPAQEKTGETGKNPAQENAGETGKNPAQEKTGNTEKNPSAGTTSEAAKKPATGTTGATEKKPAAKKAVKVKKISVTAPIQQAAAGKKVRLTAKISPKTATNQKVTWSSDNKKYAVVNASGVVTTKRAGAGKTVTITAKAKDGSGVKASIKLKIMKNAVTRVQITGAKKTLKAGKSMTLKAAVKTNGKNANKKLKWTSSNTKYAAVNAKGKVTAKKAGIGKTVTITAAATDGTGKKASVKIRIK